MEPEDHTARVHRFVGVELGAFVLEGPLGSGAMGQVYRGRHGPSGAPVAVKVLSAEHADADSRAAFRREVQTAASLQHRHVVPVYDHGTVPEAAAMGGLTVGAPYLVMALAEAGSLLSYARRLQWPAVATLLFQLLDGLAHAHARGVVHCDLKPENVLLMQEGPLVVPALADFGIAHAFRAVQATSTGQQVRGTPQFMAPEQFVCPQDIGPATDLYALGCMTYELVCRRLPFEGQTALALGMAHVRGPRPVLDPAIDVPPALAGWITRLLQVDWRARFAGAAEAAFALGRFAEPGQAALNTPEWQTGPRSVELAQFPTLPMASVPALTTGNLAPLDPAEARAAVPLTWRRLDPLPSASLAGAGRGLFGLRPVPFVAREAERDAIWAALQSVNENQQLRVIVLAGAAGTGKSRLAEWVAQRADEAGAGRYFYTRHARVAAAGHGLTGLLRRVIRPSGTPDDLARISRLRGGRQPEVQDGMVLTEAGLQVGASQPPRHRFRAIIEWLTAVARPRPPVILLDDAQWGHDSLGLVAALLANPVPALVLLTVREEEVADPQLHEIMKDPRVEILRLSPLTREAHLALVRALLPLAEETAAHVVARTEGHPLFAVQLVGAWLTQDLLQATPAGFAVVPAAMRMLPDDIHGLWAARLEEAVRTLGPEARRVLELAAVLGSEVSLDEWAAAAEAAEITADSALADGLQRLGLARRTADGFAFAHRLLRESTLRLAAEAGRLEGWHRLCIQILSKKPNLPGHFERLAEHHLALGDGGAAADALLNAGRQYSGFNQHARADQVLEPLKNLLDALAAPPDDVRRIRWELLLVMPRFAEGDPAALARLDALEAATQRQGMEAEQATLLRLRGIVARTRGDLPAARALLAEAETRLRAVGEHEQAGRAALGQLFLFQQATDLPSAQAVLARAVEDFRAANAAVWLLTARYEEGRLLFHQGALPAASQVAEAVIRGALQSGDETNQARALVLLADIDRVRDRLGPAEEAYRQAGAIFLRLGNVNHLLTEGELAAIAFLRGRHAEAATLARRCEETLAPTPYARIFWPLPLIRAVAAHLAGDRIAVGTCLARGMEGADIASNVARSYVHLAERVAVTFKGLGEPLTATRLGRLVVRLYGQLGDAASAARVRRLLGLEPGG